MKIKIDSYGTKYEYKSLEEYSEYQLNDDNYENGQIESATNTAKNNSKAIGRLLDSLVNKKVLTVEDAVIIIEGYLPGSVTLS